MASNTTLPLKLRQTMLKLPITNSLLTFISAAQTTSFAKTAKILSLTPAAVSQQIKLLEEQLDVSLFQRSKQGVELTQAGQQYLFFAEQAVESLKQGYTNLSQLKQQAIFTLHAYPSVASKWLMPKVLDAMQSEPELEIRVEASHSQVDFNLSNFDACISFGRQDGKANLNHILLFQDEVSLVASPSLISKMKNKQLDDILELPMIHIDWGKDNRFLPDWKAWLNTAGFPDRQVNKGPQFNLSSMAIEAAIQGKGLLLGQDLLIQNELKSEQLVKLSPHSLALQKAYYLIYPDRTKDKATAMHFIQQLQAKD